MTDCTYREYDSDTLTALLPLPAEDANKYTRGKLVVVAGSGRYPGAACLAAFAGQRMGAGYTEVMCARESVDVVRACRPSLVVRPWDEWEVADVEAAASTPGKPLAYVVGPGFDADGETCGRLVRRVLAHVKAPVLVDGGGLAALASKKGRRLLQSRFVEGLPTVITPHGGEAARLARVFDLPVGDGAGLCRALSQAYGVTAVLKGPNTFISDGDDVVAMREGTPALAKAGTGDVLAGMVGALLAQGLDALGAAVLGATLHARAGRVAETRLTSISVTAEDVTEAIPEAIRMLASGQ